MGKPRDSLFLQNEYPNNLFRNARMMRDRELWDSWSELSSSRLRRQRSDYAFQKKAKLDPKSCTLNYCLQVTVHDPSGSPLLKAKHVRLANKLITGCIIDCAIKVLVWTISRVNEMVEHFPQHNHHCVSFQLHFQHPGQLTLNPRGTRLLLPVAEIGWLHCEISLWMRY